MEITQDCYPYRVVKQFAEHVGEVQKFKPACEIRVVTTALARLRSSGPVFVSYSIKVCNEGAQNSSNDLNIDAAFACIGVDFQIFEGDIRVIRVPSLIIMFLRL